MKRTRDVQYTIRGIPRRVNELLRRKAKRQGKSLNTLAVEALTAAAGISEEPILYHDLDELVGTWVEDQEFDEAIRLQGQIDPAMWP